jgi:hypothetical protein
MNVFNLSFAFSMVFIIASPKLALSDSPNFAYPVISNSDDSNLFCFMQTSDGRTLNLGRICGANTNSQTSERTIRTSVINSLRNSDSVGNMGQLRNTSTSETPCFLFDAQGRPCS